MKKIISVLLVFLITLTAYSASAFAAKATYLSIGTGSVTGVYYPLGGALSSIISNQMDGYSCAAESTGGAVENASLLIDNKIDLGFVAASTLYDAQHGLDAFEGKDGTKVQALFSFFPEVVQIIAVDRSIQTIPDLAGKRVAVGSAGSGTEVMARAILALYDMSYDDINEDYLGFGDAASGLKDGTVDVAFTWAGVPTASVMELSATHSISLISFSDEELEKLMQVSSYCVPATITQETYPKMYEEAVQSFSIPAIICASSELSEDFVYDFMEKVFENTELLAQTHERGADLGLETALAGLDGAILHPGAERYFKDKGILK